jgi:predicted GTPase
VVILGAAGRDFHNFNVCYRDDPGRRVVAFTAAQIPNIAGRRYPPELAGPLYPDGIPIYEEERLPDLIRRLDAQEVVFAYSDVPHEHVMHLASVALAGGADFVLLGPRHTMLQAHKPVIAVCAVRTGAGKSPAARRVVTIIREAGRRPVVVRHPMPYGDLVDQACQRFASRQDLDRHRCTIEEREEYEPHLARGTVVYAGADSQRVLAAAEHEADAIVWDGGNNDWPFFCPDLHIVLVDPHRAGDERHYHPGEANLLMANLIVISKVNTASPEAVQAVRRSVAAANPTAMILHAELAISLDRGDLLAGRVLVIEDGPTLTHGGMAYGAGTLAAQQRGATLVDPRPWAAAPIAAIYRRYPQLGPILPAMGYSEAQLDALTTTIAAVPCDAIVCATPIDLRQLIRIDRPVVRVMYEFQEHPKDGLVVPIRRALAV